jgi:phosphatidylethanolamine/phosphatidyl-N-methylethanolamine N-methyltransferase
VKELYLFVKQFFYSPTAVGSLVPSSRKLAQSMMQNHVTSPYPKRYLEIGGGSGALTFHLINKMRPEDKLDIVETDPNFCAILRKKFGHLENISIHQRSILDFEENNYDMLLSSLPLNAFHSSTVYKILEKYEQLVKAGGNILNILG